MLARVGSLLVLVACSSPAPATSSTSPTAEAPPSPFLARRCDLMADTLRDRCAFDRATFFAQCNQLQRLGEASSCIAQTQRSFDCTVEATAACTSSACCTKAIASCDDLDTALTHCLRGYCGARGADPDCDARFGDAPTP